MAISADSKVESYCVWTCGFFAVSSFSAQSALPACESPASNSALHPI